jgi:A/G-specific adenine glycosylase
MLQQTRVDTAVPYFERFVARWPDLESLAAADEEQVLHAWAGLGYYSRARNMLKSARLAVQMGGLPRTTRELRLLPGVGPYTAGAVASIAFGVRAALVDGNVERVLSRVDALTADPRSTAGKRALWARAQHLVDHLDLADHPGTWNQALMELGATVCTPRAPSCPDCPVREYCVGLRRGVVDQLPRLAPRKKPLPVAEAAVLSRRGGRILMGRREAGGLLGGLWEPPRAALRADAVPSEVAARLLATHGLSGEVLGQVGVVVHAFSHRLLTLTVVSVVAEGSPVVVTPYDRMAWVVPDDLAMSTLARKVLAVDSGRG